MRAEIPFTSLYSQAVSLTLDETLITIRPRSRPINKAAQRSSGDTSACNPGEILFLVYHNCLPPMTAHRLIIDHSQRFASLTSWHHEGRSDLVCHMGIRAALA